MRQEHDILADPGFCKKALTMLKAGTLKEDFIEGMMCPGGCVGGPSRHSTEPETIRARTNLLKSGRQKHSGKPEAVPHGSVQHVQGQSLKDLFRRRVVTAAVFSAVHGSFRRFCKASSMEEPVRIPGRCAAAASAWKECE